MGKFGTVTFLGSFDNGQLFFVSEPNKTVTPTMYIYKFTETKRTLPIRCLDDLLYFQKRKEYKIES